MVMARRMGMSEDEFWHSCPIFFNECLEAFNEQQRKEAEAYGG